ncbi:9697_t:CDS:2 [Funneliformis caledonium]|uniref:50S ribosomal protein L35 n=1 Tax=Funneliformis caledonium TaxID=1117310 RepID=A0A9N8VEP5_9GLOM|nr:9697_t:CDS:2 [Funneliformis caledonium]
MSFLLNLGQRILFNPVVAHSSNKRLFQNITKPFSTKATPHPLLLTNYYTQKNGFQSSPFHFINLTHVTLTPPVFIRCKSTKMKTHSGAKKRFRVLGNGKFKRSKAGKRHLNTGVSRSKIRRLSKPAFAHSSQMNHLKKLMPYA